MDKRRKTKVPVVYQTVVIRTENDYRMYRVREKFAEEFAAWFNATRHNIQNAFISAYSPQECFPKLPKTLVRSFLLHKNM